MDKNNENKIAEQEASTSIDTNDHNTKESGYFVNIDGKEIKVDVKSEGEYNCLLNCLEGYYIYGNGRDDEDEEDSDDNDSEESDGNIKDI